MKQSSVPCCAGPSRSSASTTADDAEEIEKARSRHNVGGKGLASALAGHVLDRLDHLRHKHDFEKTESIPMESIEKLGRADGKVVSDRQGRWRGRNG
jgi:hypothetical protein